MPSAIMDVGRSFMATELAAARPVVLTTVKFANVAHPDPNNPPVPLATLTDIEAAAVHTQAVSGVGVIDPDNVAYSVYLDTTVGDFSITQVGYYADDNAGGLVLIMLSNIPPVIKRKNDVGQVGNNYKHTDILSILDAATITAVTVPPATWQMDFTSLMESIAENNRAVLLDLPLLNDLSPMRGVGSVTFARSTTGTYIDPSTGLLKIAAIDEPRFEDDGLLVEGASTNLLLASEDFGNAAWTDPASEWTVSTNTDADPYGGTTADEITVTGAGTGFMRQILGMTPGSTYAFSGWVRLKSGTFTGLSLDAGDGVGIDVFSQVGTSSLFRVKAVLVAGAFGWMDIVFAGCSAGAKFVVFGFQLEQLPFSSSYIPTTTTAVTRTADIPSVTYGGNMPRIGADYTWMVDFQLLGLTTSFQVLIRTANESHRNLYAYHSGPGKMVGASGPLADRQSTFTPVPGTKYRVGMSVVAGVSATFFADGINAGSFVPDTPTGTATAIYIGHFSSGTGSLFGHLANFRIYHPEIPDIQARYA